MNLIEARELMVFYENAIALNNVSLKCEKGQITGLFGANSAGKTTLMFTLSGVILDTAKKEGVIVINTPARNAVAVAEFTVSLMINISRHLIQSVEYIKNRKWIDLLETFYLLQILDFQIREAYKIFHYTLIYWILNLRPLWMLGQPQKEF